MNFQTQQDITKKIQWACNTQWDLIQQYEALHGYASKREIWPEFCKRLTDFLSDEVTLGLDQYLAKSLYHFLVKYPSVYHLEMSSDEMARAFLNFLENN